MGDNVTLGEYIEALRLRKGMKVTELAKKLKVTYIHLSNIENNKRNPSKNLLKKIANVLADDKEEKKEIYKKLMYFAFKQKMPKEISEEFSPEREAEYSETKTKMPEPFIKILKKELKQNKEKVIASNLYEVVEKAIEGKRYLKYDEVVAIAKILKMNENLFLLLAGYIPSESMKNTLKSLSTAEAFMKIMNFINEQKNTNEVINTLIQIIQMFQSQQEKQKNKKEET